jgi:hypothetical protein
MALPLQLRSPAAAAPRAPCARARTGALRAAARAGAHAGDSAAQQLGASLLPPRTGAPLWEVAAGRAAAPARTSTVAAAPALVPAAVQLSASSAALAAAGVVGAGLAAKAVFGKPARAYAPGSVGREYDAWTREGILEYYWGAWRRTAAACLLGLARASVRVRQLTARLRRQASTSTWATTPMRRASRARASLRFAGSRGADDRLLHTLARRSAPLATRRRTSRLPSLTSPTACSSGPAWAPRPPKCWTSAAASAAPRATWRRSLVLARS